MLANSHGPDRYRYRRELGRRCYSRRSTCDPLWRGIVDGQPSNLPSAAALARRAKQKYDATYGADRPALPSGIEEQAEFFFDCNELGTVYLRTYIDNDAFAGPPNAGHIAIADLLLVGGIQTAASTNVDTMIETAGMMLFGRIGAGIDGITVAALPPHRAPLLKIHGCWGIDPTTTVWTARQLLVEPIASRISSSETWLSVRLLDRDLVIVGYWTDWDYLNDVLARALGQVRPARVIVVDPSESATLAAKAPTFSRLGNAPRPRSFTCKHRATSSLTGCASPSRAASCDECCIPGESDFEKRRARIPTPR